MSRLTLTNEKIAATLDRAVLVLIPAWLTWYALGKIPYWLGATTLGGEVIATPETILLARTFSILVGILIGVPVALAIVNKADGWEGLLEELRSPDTSGERSTSDEG